MGINKRALIYLGGLFLFVHVCHGMQSSENSEQVGEVDELIQSYQEEARADGKKVQVDKVAELINFFRRFPSPKYLVASFLTQLWPGDTAIKGDKKASDIVCTLLSMFMPLLKENTPPFEKLAEPKYKLRAWLEEIAKQKHKITRPIINVKMEQHMETGKIRSTDFPLFISSGTSNGQGMNFPGIPIPYLAIPKNSCKIVKQPADEGKSFAGSIPDINDGVDFDELLSSKNPYKRQVEEKMATLMNIEDTVTDPSSLRCYLFEDMMEEAEKMKDAESEAEIMAYKHIFSLSLKMLGLKINLPTGDEVSEVRKYLAGLNIGSIEIHLAVPKTYPDPDSYKKDPWFEDIRKPLNIPMEESADLLPEPEFLDRNEGLYFDKNGEGLFLYETEDDEKKTMIHYSLHVSAFRSLLYAETPQGLQEQYHQSKLKEAKGALLPTRRL